MTSSTTRKPFMVRLSDEERERVEKQAKLRGLSVAACVRMAVLAWLRPREESPPGSGPWPEG